MWMYPCQLKLSSKVFVLFIDGTARTNELAWTFVAPITVTQFRTVMPLSFMLCPTERTSAIAWMLNEMIKQAPILQKNVNTIFLDDLASPSMLQSCFPEAQLLRCFFHMAELNLPSYFKAGHTSAMSNIAYDLQCAENPEKFQCIWDKARSEMPKDFMFVKFCLPLFSLIIIVITATTWNKIGFQIVIVGLKPICKNASLLDIQLHLLPNQHGIHCIHSLRSHNHLYLFTVRLENGRATFLGNIKRKKVKNSCRHIPFSFFIFTIVFQQACKNGIFRSK
jgi:hypothetical protein